MWGLVKISPSADTKDDEPFGARAEESRTWSSHAWSGANPYLAFTLSTGKWLNSHMPSSAKARLPKPSIRMHRKRTKRVFMKTPDTDPPHRARALSSAQGIRDEVSKTISACLKQRPGSG